MYPASGNRTTRSAAAVKLFTPALANRTLPLVRSIVDDILEKAKELRGKTALSRDPEVDDEIARVLVAMRGVFLQTLIEDPLDRGRDLRIETGGGERFLVDDLLDTDG